jgi:hypothetical protein
MTHDRQNLTIRVSPETIRKARILAARRSTSISRLVAEQLDALVAGAEAYERDQRAALALLDQGFPLGGRITASRDDWHER